jgi:hypothetical protein
MKKLVIFLIRKKLGLRLCEKFQFIGQKSDAVYWFTKEKVLKYFNGYVTPSNVSLNWLLDDDCIIKRV